MTRPSDPPGLNGRILHRLELNATRGAHSVLAEIVHLQRAYHAALDSNDADLAAHYLHILRIAVAEQPLEPALRDVGSHREPPPDLEDKVWQRIDQSRSWWHPLTTRLCLTLAALDVRLGERHRTGDATSGQRCGDSARDVQAHEMTSPSPWRRDVCGAVTGPEIAQGDTDEDDFDSADVLRGSVYASDGRR
jgi:hypothetical protein